MIITLIAWIIVGSCFLGVPAFYFVHMKKQSTRPWRLNIDANYLPSVAILVPIHNEEKTIHLKLENLSRIKYPLEKTQIIIVNDASEDGAMSEISRYMAIHPNMRISVFDSKEHVGKTHCLNRALKSVKTDVVIISDADCFWPSDILEKSMLYLSDPNVGAITAREFLLNPGGSWVTLGEQFYDTNIQILRVGESKVHSTLFFQGGFAAFKRSLIDEFDHATDDSGTALHIIQKSSRALLIPEIGFYTTFPTIWKNKMNLKLRRASQLQSLWFKCLNLLVHRKLIIPKKIAVPEIFLYIFNPLLLVVLGFLSVFAFVDYPLFMLTFVLIFSALFIVKKTRPLMIEILQNNLILLTALTSFFNKRKGFKLWKTEQESRSLLSEETLKKIGLV